MDGKTLQSELRFEWHDYILLILMLVGSTGIGVYFGLAGKNSKMQDYLFGGKTMTPLPIAISLTASSVTAIIMTSVPADIYKFGGSIGLIMIGIQMALAFVYCTILPIFYNLQVCSVFEYFELRFNKTLQPITSCIFSIGVILLLPVVLIMPALTISQATGLNVYLVSVVVFGICVFYTLIGGIKAVVWTDVLQAFIMLLSMLAIIIMGTIRLGGIKHIWQTSLDGGRLDIDFSLDPTIRDTFWSIIVGFSVTWIKMFANQLGMQKCLTLPTYSDVKKAYIWSGIILAILYFMVTYTGLMLYTEFKDCDPLKSGKVRTYDQMVPYYIIVLTRHIPGLAGIFIAGITSGSISSISCYLNVLACIIYNDIVKIFLKKDMQEVKIRKILGLIVFVVGLISCGLIFVIAKLVGMFSLVMSFTAISSGPILGLFFLGMFSPRANTKGAFCGLIGSIVFMTWIVLGKQYYIYQKYVIHEMKPVSTQGCITPVNQTIYEKPENKWTPFFLFRISFYHYTLLGILVVFVIGLPISWLTKEDGPVRQELISPVMRWTLKRKNNTTYSAVEMTNREDTQLAV